MLHNNTKLLKILSIHKNQPYETDSILITYKNKLYIHIYILLIYSYVHIRMYSELFIKC